MSADLACFAESYAQARARFLARAAAAGLNLSSQVLPLPGAAGEELALDAAWQGEAGSDKLLIVSSACHGVEGYAGSAAQCALLADGALAQAARERGIAVLYLHALNPHGFSWGRRVTHENIDLNRNFIDFARPLPVNRDYERIASLLIPREWPPGPANALRIALVIARHGMRAAQAALSSGQYADPRGLFYGGQAPAWSNTALRRVLRQFGAGRARIAWIDVHTGLGRRGDVERILAARHDAATVARARLWWGEHVTSTQDDSSVSPALHGQMWAALYDECAGCEYTGIALEFGTVSRLEALQALRGDQWLALHPDAPPALQRAIRRRLRAAFYDERPAWREHVLRESAAAVRAALDGLR